MPDREREHDPAVAPEEASGPPVTGADVESALRGFGFPGTARDLLEAARQNGADESVMERLGTLPDRTYSSLGDTLRALDMLS